MKQPSGLVPRPDHVAEDRVVDFDFLTDERFARVDMHDVMAWLARDTPGVFWTPRNGGHWVVCRYDALFDLTRDPEHFGTRSVTLPPMEQEPVLIPLNFDGHLHVEYRLPLVKTFSPAAMRSLEGKIAGLANSLIDAVIDDGACNFVEAVGEVLPVMVFMELMGMPTDRLQEFRGWASATMSPEGDRDHAFANIVTVMNDLVRQRQAERRDDLISRLLDSSIGGRPVSDEEMQAYCIMLFIAGLDTVANSLALGIRHLAIDLPLQDRLRANPDEIPAAVEEFLRRYSTAIGVREVNRDTNFDGVTMKQGERALLLLPAGNLDTRVFPDATSTDIDRDNKVHAAFGMGPHRCVGSHLARIELNIAYREWLRRVPAFRLDPDRPPSFRQGLALAVNALPLRWDAASA